MKRFVAVLSVLSIFLLCVACASNPLAEQKPTKEPVQTGAPGETTEAESVPTATPNPNITNPEGQVMGGENPFIEGKITALDEKNMTILAGGVQYTLALGKQGAADLKIFNRDKDKPRIVLGTYVIAYYQTVANEKVIKSLEILEAN